MRIRELMSGGLITVRRETSVLEARDLMAREKIRHLLVTDDSRALAGIVTDRDIRLNLPSQATSLSVGEINHLLAKLTVGQVMTRAVITIGPDRLARDGAQIMLDRKIGALPVLEDDHLIGIITETDIVRAFITLTAPLVRR
jgi:acetoin utilization protein AcuB